jgi:hypothetical protein
MPAVTTRGMAAFLLLLMLAAFPGIAALPHQVASVRVAGLAVLWWYGGVVAPFLAALIAVAWLPVRAPSRRPE